MNQKEKEKIVLAGKVIIFIAAIVLLVVARGTFASIFPSFVPNSPTGSNLTLATYTASGAQPVRLDVYVCGEYNGGCLNQTSNPYGWPGVYSSTSTQPQNGNHTAGLHFVCNTHVQTITYYNNAPGYTGDSLPTVFSINGSTSSTSQFSWARNPYYQYPTGDAMVNISATGALCDNIVFPAGVSTGPYSYAPYTFSITVVVNQSGFQHNSYYYDGINTGTSPGVAIYDIGTLQVYPLATQTVSSTSTSTASTSSSSTTTITGIPVTSQGTTSLASTTTIQGSTPQPLPSATTYPSWWEFWAPGWWAGVQAWLATL